MPRVGDTPRVEDIGCVACLWEWAGSFPVHPTLGAPTQYERPRDHPDLPEAWRLVESVVIGRDWCPATPSEHLPPTVSLERENVWLWPPDRMPVPGRAMTSWCPETGMGLHWTPPGGMPCWMLPALKEHIERQDWRRFLVGGVQLYDQTVVEAKRFYFPAAA